MSRYDELEPGEDFPFLENIGPQKVVDRATDVSLRTRTGRRWPLGQRRFLGEARNSVEDGATISSPRATKYPKWLSKLLYRVTPKPMR